MSPEDFIFSVVDAFYSKAKDDILIGYHFRNIPDFDTHIPRIAAFWEIQLLGTSSRELDAPFDMMKAHIPLGIKRGELGRWLLLFRRELDARRDLQPELSKTWDDRLKFFEGVFLRFFGL